MKILLMLMLIGCGTDLHDHPKAETPPAATQCIEYFETKNGGFCNECSTDCMKIIVCTPLEKRKIDDGIQHE